MKPLSSAITGLHLAVPSSIGMPLSETGSGALAPWGQRDPNLYVIHPPTWLQPIVTNSVAFLVTWVGMKRSLPLGYLQDSAASELHDALLGLRAMFEPATPTKIGKTLEGMAQIFRAALPEEVGLRGYIHALSDLPNVAFDEAARTLIKSHRYPNLPLPAEFITAGDKIVQALQFWETRLTRAADTVSRL